MEIEGIGAVRGLGFGAVAGLSDNPLDWTIFTGLSDCVGVTGCCTGG